MTLTANDLQEVRTVIREEVQGAFDSLGRQIVKEEVRSYFTSEGRELIREEVEALEKDVREIYRMLSRLQKNVFTDKQFKKLNLEQQLATINAELISVAKQAGITLRKP